MIVQPQRLPGLQLIELPRFEDDRGWFAELWHEERYRAAGLAAGFVQDNVSFSRHGVLRGMHFQHPRGQGKLVTVLHGAVFDAVVDVRTGSPTFGAWFGCELSAGNRRQLWVPPGFAHGFLVLSDGALVHYSCSSCYDAGCDRSLAWDDAAIGIEWPAQPLTLSARDRAAKRLSDHAHAGLPVYDGDAYGVDTEESE